MKQDIAELRYKGRIIKIDIVYDEVNEDIIPLYNLHDLLSVRHNNRNKRFSIKTKVNPKTEVEEIYLFPYSEITEQTAQETIVLDATALYANCGSCHGQKGEKSALGKSQVIAGWDKQRVIDSLNGYKDGSYGGVMKNIMTGQVNTKTEAEIEALADLISKM